MNIWLVFIWRPVRSESLVKLLRSSTEHYNTDQQFLSDGFYQHPSLQQAF